MKKTLLILALAIMASAASVANARTLSGIPRGSDLVITDPNVRMSHTNSTVTINLYAGYASWISIENWNTGEKHSLTFCPAQNSVTVCIRDIVGTWEVKGTYDKGEPFYGRFFINNSNPHQLYPVGWVQTVNPFDDRDFQSEP